MSVQIAARPLRAAPWEPELLARAHAALAAPGDSPPPAVAAARLRAAHAYCTRLTRRHSCSFYLATAVLPRAKRQALRALYAFCRVSDDLVDRAGGDGVAALARWRAQLAAPDAYRHHPVLLAWADTRARYRISPACVAQLLDTLAQDRATTRYHSFPQLAAYCYGVASTVGLMAMQIIGYAGPQAVPFAVKLGVALQLTNILRDVREDWERGRLYLPLDELAAFGLSEAEIAARRLSDRWRAFMRFQIAWTRRLYREALPGIRLLHPSGRFAVATAAELYRGILDDIEAHGYDVFSRRAHLSDWHKLRRLPGIWWRARRGYPAPAGAAPERC